MCTSLFSDKTDLFNLHIDNVDMDICRKIKKNWDGISKPIDGLGDFEDALCRIGAAVRSESPKIRDRAVVIMCADNGIVEEGVSQTGKEVTLQVARMLGEGKSTANTMAKAANVKCVPVDIGIDSFEEITGVSDCKVRRGTRNFLREEALTEAEVLKAIDAGISIAKKLTESGVDILATGEMGIGNTTTTSALLCLLLNEDAGNIVGRGAGLDDDGLLRKLRVVEAAIVKYRNENAADKKENAFTYLCQVGGLDIAGLCGVFIGGALFHVPVVIDGVISAVAAYLAEIFVPGCRDYMLASHSGRETGLMQILNKLDLKPLINGNMALGEGTGAIMLFPVLDVAFSLYNSGSTFKDGGIDEYQRF